MITLLLLGTILVCGGFIIYTEFVQTKKDATEHPIPSTFTVPEEPKCAEIVSNKIEEIAVQLDDIKDTADSIGKKVKKGAPKKATKKVASKAPKSSKK